MVLFKRLALPAACFLRDICLARSSTLHVSEFIPDYTPLRRRRQYSSSVIKLYSTVADPRTLCNKETNGSNVGIGGGGGQSAPYAAPTSPILRNLNFSVSQTISNQVKRVIRIQHPPCLQRHSASCT
jgi:hypothetical protein